MLSPFPDIENVGKPQQFVAMLECCSRFRLIRHVDRAIRRNAGGLAERISGPLHSEIASFGVRTR